MSILIDKENIAHNSGYVIKLNKNNWKVTADDKFGLNVQNRKSLWEARKNIWGRLGNKRILYR